MSEFKFIDMGSLKEFLEKLKQLNKRCENREFRFEEIENSSNGFWLFEEEDDDEILGGVLHVQKDRVYAISPDVQELVLAAFSR